MNDALRVALQPIAQAVNGDMADAEGDIASMRRRVPPIPAEDLVGVVLLLLSLVERLGQQIDELQQAKHG